MSNFKITISQTNNQGKTSFSAAAKLGLPDESELQAFGLEVANFCKDTIDFAKRSKNRGLNIKGIRKTLPVDIALECLDENDDMHVSLHFTNFGKFVESATKEQLTKQLADSAEFELKYFQWA